MEKWFYPLQAKSKEMIEEKYEILGYCNYQDILKDRVYENWNVQRKSDGKRLNLLVAMHKSNMIVLYEETEK